MRFGSSRAPGPFSVPEVALKVRIAIAGLAALAVFGACGQEAETKGGTVQPASSSETTVTTAAPAPSTTAAPAPSTSTTAKPATTSTTEAPTTTTTEAPAQTVSYANCDAVKAAGAAPIHRGDPGYSTKLDRDGDGIACEK